MMLAFIVLFLVCQIELSPCEEHDYHEGNYKYPFSYHFLLTFYLPSPPKGGWGVNTQTPRTRSL